MIIIEKPDNEDLRIQALRSYQVLDSAQEQDYDDIVNMASEICDASVAYVSFIDEERQWFKSTKNFDFEELPRNQSICAYAITTPEKMLVVDNLENDDRFHDHPAVTGDMKVKFYASIALVNDDGYELGTICVFDKKEKELRPKQLNALKALARQVINVLELKKLQIIHERNIEILDQRNKTFEEYVVDQTRSVSSTLTSINLMTDLLKKHINSNNIDKAQEQIPKIQEYSSEVIKIIDQVRKDYLLIDMCAKKKERIDLKKTLDEIFSSDVIKKKRSSFIYTSEKKAIYENKFLVTNLLTRYVEVVALVNATSIVKFSVSINSNMEKSDIIIMDDAITPIDQKEFLNSIHLLLSASGTQMKIKFLKGQGHTAKISFII